MQSLLMDFDIWELGIILLMIYLFIYLLFVNRTKKLEDRIGRYCIYNYKRSLVINYIYCFYKGIIRSISFFIMKIPLFSVYIKQYELYITKEKKNHVIPADLISNKILVSAIFVLMAVYLKHVNGNIITNSQIVVLGLLGYIIPDVYNIIKYNNRK